ncbi:MAG: hypothetical protein ACYDC9_13060 [Dermatophilaceae bacterium]
MRTWGPGLLLVSPSILLVGFFVYALIGWTANISTTNQNSRFERAAGTSPDAHIGLANYTALFASPDFIASLKHLGILAVVYIVGALFFGTPLLAGSTPVSAVQPEANARRTNAASRRPLAFSWGAYADRRGLRHGCMTAKHLQHAESEHGEHAQDETVGGDREELARLLGAAQVHQHQQRGQRCVPSSPSSPRRRRRRDTRDRSDDRTARRRRSPDLDAALTPTSRPGHRRPPGETRCPMGAWEEIAAGPRPAKRRLILSA